MLCTFGMQHKYEVSEIYVATILFVRNSTAYTYPLNWRPGVYLELRRKAITARVSHIFKRALALTKEFAKSSVWKNKLFFKAEQNFWWFPFLKGRPLLVVSSKKSLFETIFHFGFAICSTVHVVLLIKPNTETYRFEKAQIAIFVAVIFLKCDL